jgi:hypothetical protein
MPPTQRDLEAAWLAGYRARGARIITMIQTDRGGPESAAFRQLVRDYRRAVHDEAQDASDADKDVLAEELAQARAEFARGAVARREDRVTSTEADAALYEARRGRADGD